MVGHRLAAACAHAIALDRQGTRDVAHGWVGPASIECAMLSRGGTALVMGHWVEVSRVVCGRLGVVCELARPLGRALELSDRTQQHYVVRIRSAYTQGDCVTHCVELYALRRGRVELTFGL